MKVTRALPLTRRISIALTSMAVSLGVAGCDDEGAAAPAKGESVAEGAKAETAPGKMVEKGKQQIEAAEQQMEVRDQAIIDAAAGEKVERGQVP